MADRMRWQVDAVRSALAKGAIAPSPPITAVLCFLNVEWPIFGAPDRFRGVRIESHRSIKRLVTKPALLTEWDSDRITSTLSTYLPAK
jgi:hypothetical protein